MKHKKKKNYSRGFLLIVAIILTVIVGFIGTILVYQFSGIARSTGDIAQSNAALYIASSGLEIAKRDIIKNEVSCNTIMGGIKYTNAALFNGNLTVSSNRYVANSILNQPITNVSTSFTIANAATFSPQSGFAILDNEFITYAKKSGNALQGVQRGVGGTVAIAHNAGTIITQNQCLLTSEAGVPTLSASSGKRILQKILFGQTLSFPGAISTSLATCGEVSLNGNATIINPSATCNGTNFSAYTIVTNSTVTINGANAGTAIGNPPVPAGPPDCVSGGDILQNYTINDCANSGLFALFFTQPFNYFLNIATTIGSGSLTLNGNTTYNLANTGGPILKWNGDIVITGNSNVLNIGNPNAPIMLIVNGDIKMSGGSNTINIGNINNSQVPVILIVAGASGNFSDTSVTGSNTIALYGFLYTKGSIQLSGTSNFQGYGMIAAEGTAILDGDVSFNFNPSILNLFLTIPDLYTTNTYSPSLTITQEIFK